MTRFICIAITSFILPVASCSYSGAAIPTIENVNRPNIAINDADDMGRGNVGENPLGTFLTKGNQYTLSLNSGDELHPANIHDVRVEPVPTVPQPASSDKPNIVLIMADDLGRECIGAYGSMDYKTPILDRMARDGIKFEHCYSQPLCTPSRVKIMTGRYAFRNYIRFGELDTHEITFGNVLRQAGYRTCMVGKWQLGGDYTTPNEFGFDEYCLQNAIVPAKKFDRSTRGNERYWGYPVIVANGNLYESIHRFGPDMISEYATNFIRQKKDRPFFLYYPMILPHAPFAPSPLSSDGDKSGGKVSEVKYFKDMVEYVDVLVGRVTQALEDTGQRENTIIIFTGDNGSTYPVQVTKAAPEGYPKVLGINGARHASQLPPGAKPTPRKGLWEGPLTRTDTGLVPGGKDLMSERGTHVPLIIDWPRNRSVYQSFGNACDDLVDFSDFFVTFADLAGADLPQDRTIDGISFAPRLEEGTPSPRDYTFCHYWGFGRKRKKRVSRSETADGSSIVTAVSSIFRPISKSVRRLNSSHPKRWRHEFACKPSSRK